MVFYVFFHSNEIMFSCTNVSIICNIYSCFKRFLSHNQAFKLIGQTYGKTNCIVNYKMQLLLFLIHHSENYPRFFNSSFCFSSRLNFFWNFSLVWKLPCNRYKIPAQPWDENEAQAENFPCNEPPRRLGRS